MDGDNILFLLQGELPEQKTPVACLEMSLSGKQNDEYDLLLPQSRARIQYVEEGRAGWSKPAQSHYLLGR